MTPCYLRLLRDEGAAAENLARVLSAGRLAPDLLLRAPEAVALLGDPEGLRPRGRAHLEQEVLAAVGRADGAEQAVAAARGGRQREMFRTAAADVLKSARSASGAVRPIVSWPPPAGDGAPATPPTPRVPRDAPPSAEIPGALRDPLRYPAEGLDEDATPANWSRPPATWATARAMWARCWTTTAARPAAPAP